MIKLDIKPIKNKIEIPGYGVFEVSPLGAGAEAEIRIAFRKIDQVYEEAKKYQGIVDREKNGEKLDRESDEYKEAIKAFNEVSKVSGETRDIVLSKMKMVINGDNLEKLFADFTYSQIQEIYRKAIGEDGESL